MANDGLLGFFDSPAGAGLLSAVAGGLAGARRGTPVNNAGRGLLSGLAGYSQANEDRLKMAELKRLNQVRDLQQQQAQFSFDSQKAEQSRQDQLQKAITGGLTPATPATTTFQPTQPISDPFNISNQNSPVTPPASLNVSDYPNTVTPAKPASLFGQQLDPLFAAQLPYLKPDAIQARLDAIRKSQDPIKLGEKERLLQPGTFKELVGADPSLPAGFKLDPVTGQANYYPGFIEQQAQLKGAEAAATFPYQRATAAAGATRLNIPVNTEKTYAGNIAEGLAKNDVAAIDAAQSAGQRIESAQRVKQLLTQTPITGTGAEARLSLTKALSTYGLIDGRQVKTTEDLASTLASQTLDAIKTSGLGSGQGFTDKDRAFLERAKSGNIEINSGTLNTLSDLNERSARASLKRGRDVASRIKNNPAFGSVGQDFNFYEPPPLPDKNQTTQSGLTKQEQSELQQLRERFKK